MARFSFRRDATEPPPRLVIDEPAAEPAVSTRSKPGKKAEPAPPPGRPDRGR